MLQPVRLGADLQSVLRNDVQVDEETSSDERGEECLARRAARQSLHRRPFGVVVVVDVHAGVCAAARREELDEPLHHSGLRVEVVSPTPVIGEAAPSVLVEETAEEEQVVLRRPEGMALEVEKDVAVVGRRKQVKSVSEDGVVSRRDQFVDRRRVGTLARLELERRLAMEPHEILLVQLGHRFATSGQLDHGSHPDGFERLTF